MHWRTILILTAALVVATAGVAAAERDVAFGGQISYADDFDLGVGARAVIGTNDVVEGTRAVASFDLYFPGDEAGVEFSFWEINVNGHYMFPLEEKSFGLYAGAGLHYANVSVDTPSIDTGFGVIEGGSVSDSEVGLNLLGGVDFQTSGSVSPFAEIKIELGGAEQFVISGGATF